MNEICLSCRKHTKCGRAKHETIGCGYYVPMSNEEWLRQAATEQLAEKLTDFSFWLVFTIPTEDKRKKVRKRIVEWLKQPHKEIEK